MKEPKEKIMEIIGKITACNDGALAIIQNQKIEAFSAETLLKDNAEYIDKLYSLVDESLTWSVE